MTRKNNTGSIFKALILTLVSIWLLLPLYLIVMTAFKPPAEFTVNPLGVPSRIYFENFITALTKGKVLSFGLNSVFVTVISLVLIVTLNLFCAYGLNKIQNKLYGKLIYSFLMTGMMIAAVGYVTMILLYQRAGLYDSLWGVIVSTVAGSVPLACFLLMGAIRAIPGELLEAATIDGASDMQSLLSVILPLITPTVSTIIVLNLITSWNALLTPLLLLRSAKNYTLPIGLLTFRGTYNVQYTVLFAAMLMSAVPLIIVYFTLQKKFVESLAGALKG